MSVSLVTCDIVVVGGSLGGVAAALAASDDVNRSVYLLEASTWLGGQFSAQGVTRPDENQYIESVGSTASYRAFRQSVRKYYRDNFDLSAAGDAQPSLDPGGPYPGFSTSPRVAHQVLLSELQGRANVRVRFGVRLVSASTITGDTVASIVVEDSSGAQTTYTARYFLDATDLGDLLPVANVEYRLGAEGSAEFNEPAAPAVARPDWIQPITMVIALERRPEGENHTIAKPANYDALKLSQKYSILDGYITKMFVEGIDLWSYRRYIDARNFNDPSVPFDLSMLNMGANDYQGGTLPTGSADGDVAVIEAARQASLGYVYWLQTEVPRDDGKGQGYPNLRVKADDFGTADGTSAQAYIRESRRIKARYTISQSDLDKALSPGPRGKRYADSCGIGFYGGLDIHGLAAVGMAQQFINIWPFHLPLASLIPIRVTNVLPACKNIGVTHVTNGAYRLHPMEWNVGEVAGALAAYAVANAIGPGTIATGALLKSFQHALLHRGVPLFWWSDITFDDADLFAAVHLLGVNGLANGDNHMRFQPHDTLTDGDKADFASAAGKTIAWPPSPMTRGQAAKWLATYLDI